LRFNAQGVVEILARAAELPPPRFERIRFVAIDHVAHCQPQRVEVVLDAQELERILAAALDGARLEVLEHRDLAQGVEREHGHGGQRDGEAHQQPGGRR
jgi:hypothetical protein